MKTYASELVDEPDERPFPKLGKGLANGNIALYTSEEEGVIVHATFGYHLGQRITFPFSKYFDNFYGDVLLAGGED